MSEPDIDLKTRRNIERFLRLIDVRAVGISRRLEFSDGPFRLFIEVRDSNFSPRVYLGAMISASISNADGVFITQLSRWPIERALGIPLRFFNVVDGLAVVATMPVDSGAELWLQMYRVQRRLLESHHEENT